MKKDLSLILKKVTNPAQYIDSEWNTDKLEILSKWNKPQTIKVCLCFPDKYVVGMSNLGIMILYKLLNSYEDVLCERVFAVDVDMEKILLKENISIFSLETRHELKSFDIIGFSLQDELNYLNIFSVLYLAGIPIRREQRESLFPLIIAGGPCCSNPHVLENYIDFFVLGEAEEVIKEIIDILRNFKKEQKRDKKELLKKIDTLKETFVPEFSKKNVYPSTVDITKSFYPIKPLVPLIRVAHSRLNIEVTRGCGHSCNFCQATYINRPLRYREKEFILSILETSLKSTGYDEVAFTGFCVTDYPYLKELIRFVYDKFSDYNVSVSLPSLRIENIDEDLIESLSLFRRKPTITLAVEAATERLRKVLNKSISNEDIFNKIKILYKYGFYKIKLYFMIGLPTETFQDIQFIPILIKKIKKYFSKLRLNITISIFLPKPHTPFQFAGMERYDELYKKVLFLKKNLYKEVNFGKIEEYIYKSYIQALIARGNSQIGEILKNVWLKGARFLNWSENFDLELWKDSIPEEFLEEFIFTKRDNNYNFVWDNIKYPVSKEVLYKRYINAISNNYSDEKNIFVDDKIFLEINNTQNNYDINPVIKKNLSSLYTLRLKFSRRDDLKFISYLDEVEIFKKILRMAEIPVCYTQGFNPQIKISLPPATPLGYESNSEYLDVEVFQPIEKEELSKKIKQFLPEGLFFLDAKIFNAPLNKVPSLNSTVNLIEYFIKYPKVFSKEKLEKFLSLNSFFITKKVDNNLEKINLFEIIKEIKLIDDFTIFILLRFLPKKNLKPEVIIENIFGISQDEYHYLDIIRNELYIELNSGKILTLI